MPKENQNIEYKESWSDEYLKWICGFANAQGGTLVIGKTDKGVIKGVTNAKRLLEEIPNKVRDILGIMVDVNLKRAEGKDILHIKVDAYPYAVSYKGQYHYRSGSTKQELRGAALDKFILQKHGKTWDGVPMPNVHIKDLQKTAFDTFRKRAKEAGRLAEDALKESNEILIEKLRLKENQFLKRAAILLFHPDPEKFVTGSYIKIGFFRSHHDLVFQDEVHGNLFEQIEKVIEILAAKYFRAEISYENMIRKETLPYPIDALRETILNAIIHKDYASNTPIQISVYDDKLMIWNSGKLPENWTVSKLKQKHASIPHNPDIAHAFFRAGWIEAWGRGITKIIDECKRFKSAAPKIVADVTGIWFTLYPRRHASEKTSEKTSEKIIRLLRENSQMTIAELAKTIGVSARSIERNLEVLQKNKQIKRVGADRGGKWQVL